MTEQAERGMELESDAVSLSWRPSHVASSLSWGGFSAFLALAGSRYHPMIGASLVCLAIAAIAFVAGRLGRSGKRAKLAPASVAVGDGKLAIAANGEPRFAAELEDIDAGWIEEPSTAVVALHRGPEVRMSLASAGDAQALLGAMGVAAAERVLRAPLYGWVGTLRAGELLATIFLVVLAPFWFMLGLFVSQAVWLLASHPSSNHILIALAGALLLAIATGVALLVVRLMSHREVVIGTDGIVLEGVGRRVVIPLAEIEAVSRMRYGLLVQSRSGKRYRLPTSRADAAFPVAATGEQQARADVLEQRIAEVRQRRGDRRNGAALLERGGRSLEAWTSELGSWDAAHGDYRRRSLGREALEEIATDGRASAEQRVAAVFALGHMRPASAGAIERAIAATADPALSRALRAAGDGNIDEQALARLAGRYRVVEGDSEPPSGGTAEATSSTSS